MNEMEELYREIILDHNKRPRNFRKMEDCTHHAEGHNPLCGDEIEVFVKVDNGVITDISFEGEGCAISKSSASLMTTALKGKTIEEAHREAGIVISMLSGKTDANEIDELGDIAALQGVRQFPARIKCATLSWHALEASLIGKDDTSTE
ncbi:MAG: SUF system NifU family Fe-S cluster assembly protein [Opitutales bacterium]|nr:SUF system NifU family Fe-S cluster assembly protein [Opitutales bacterium]